MPPAPRGGRPRGGSPRAALGPRDPWASAEAGAVRFNEFKQTLEGIPPRTLAARLNELEEAGVLERQVFDTRPPRVEYRLTEAGRRFRYIVEALNALSV